MEHRALKSSTHVWEVKTNGVNTKTGRDKMGTNRENKTWLFMISLNLMLS